MSRILSEYYREHSTLFEEYFRRALNGFEVEAIHKMRTSTKRLRALFQLIEFLTNKEFKARKQLLKARMLFKHGGRIREIQIEEMLLMQYEPILKHEFPEYLAYLKWRKHKEMTGFLKSKPVLKSKGPILDNYTIIEALVRFPAGEQILPEATRFVNDRFRRIRKNIRSHPSNHRIHQNRTYLKQIFYLHEMLEPVEKSKHIFPLDPERIREIEQYLGNWHDLVNSPVFMNAFLMTKNATHKGKYKLLKERIAEDRKAMRNYIISVFYPELSVK